MSLHWTVRPRDRFNCLKRLFVTEHLFVKHFLLSRVVIVLHVIQLKVSVTQSVSLYGSCEAVLGQSGYDLGTFLRQNNQTA